MFARSSATKIPKARKERGSATLEMALCCAFLFISFFPTFGICIYFFQQLSIQYSIQSAMRWAILGERLRGMTREQSIETRVRMNASNLGIDLSSSTIRVCPASEANVCTSNYAGVGDELIVISVEHPVTIFGTQTLIAKAQVIGKNEPFS